MYLHTFMVFMMTALVAAFRAQEEVDNKALAQGKDTGMERYRREVERANRDKILVRDGDRILPWVHSENLAPLVGPLGALVGSGLGSDLWTSTLVARNLCRRSTLFRDLLCAANWVHLGLSQGRGKTDRYTRHELPAKDIYVYPLHRRAQERLRAP